MLTICGRKVKVATGAKSQTVNVCTEKNQLGQYSYTIRMKPPCENLERELTARAINFHSLDEFVHHVAETYQGIIEPVKRSMAADSPSHSVQATDSFQAWRQRWDDLMSYTGSDLPEPQQRIESLRQLWNQPVPGGWKRGVDPQLRDDDRYRRGDRGRPNPGEHQMEHEILIDQFHRLNFLGYQVIDGINAMPLTTDPGGGRRGNVEADLFLLLRKDAEYLLAICEVKSEANHVWYAVVENMRQLKLLQLSDAAKILFHLRNPDLHLPSELPVMGCIIAPDDFYHHAGRKRKAKPFAEHLIRQFHDWTGGVAMRLATWDPSTGRIKSV
ncbi:MAG: hypothetical protein HQL98_13475 [Magnetococcales bacterium]|nr:hypothetical protein [Magnetococcales bacterium]